MLHYTCNDLQFFNMIAVQGLAIIVHNLPSQDPAKVLKKPPSHSKQCDDPSPVQSIQ